MPWYIPIPGLIPISEYVKKKMCIYLLQRYLGKFFEEKLTLDQLSLDVYNGTGIVRNVSLDVQALEYTEFIYNFTKIDQIIVPTIPFLIGSLALNDLGEKQNWPMEFVDGYLEQLHVSVPWTSLLSDSTSLEVTGLKLTVQPKQRHESATSVFESMWSSMTSSMQLAKDYIQQEPNVNDSQPFEGIEKFAQTIDSVLTRVKIKFIDTTIQIEHVPKNCLTGVAIQIHIGTIEYLDEASSDPSADDEPLPQDQGRAYVISSFTTKRIHLDNVTLHTVEFPSTARTFSRSIIIEQQQCNELGGMLRKPEMDSIEKLINSDGNEKDNDSENLDNNDHSDGRHEIIFGKLMGKQEIRVRLKHSEHVSGSKVSIEVNLGGCVMFLTPRQVHVLSELIDGISSPDIEDNSNVPPKQKCVEKLMTSLDYQRVEQDLQDQVNPNIEVTGLLGLCGWSKGMTDTDDVFHPMINNESCDRSASSVLYDSAVSHASSSTESSLSSSMVSSISEVTSIRRRNNIENDPSAEITHFQIRIASLSVLLLHDDILSLTYDECSRSHNLIPSSIIQMKRTAESFFYVIGEYNITAYGGHQFDNTKSIFEQACHFNHLRLIAAAIQIEGRESTTLADFSISGKLTVAKLELLECLYNDTTNITPSMGHSGTSALHEAVSYIRLLYFSENSAAPPTETTNNFRIKPCVKISFKHDEKFCNIGSKKGCYMPKTELVVTLDACCIELDITIVNRISASITGAPVCVCRDTSATRITSKNEKNTESRLDFTVKSSEITINLRFPVPDLRPKHDMNRRPWWQREVRADYLTMCMYEASANTSYTTSLLSQKYTVRCKQAALSYHETESSIPIALGQIMSFTDSIFEQQCPCFDIELRPEEICVPETVLHDLDPMLQSAYPGLKLDNSGPFSSTRVMHESDTPHAKLHQDDSEQLIIPGDRAEMKAFIAESSATSRMAITISLPTIYIDLVNKHIYEVLYNRINSDLLLWEPSAPEPHWPRTTTPLGSVLGADSNVRKGMTLDSDWFEMCKSGIQYESESDTSSTDDICPESENIFNSKYDSRSSASRFRCNLETKSQLLNANENRVGMKNSASKLSEFTLLIFVGNGKVHLSPPARDTSPSTAVLPNHSGQLLFLVENGASIFCVAGYAGDSSLTYVCVQVADVQLHHCDMVSLSNPADSFDIFSGKCNIQLHPTIYKSDPGILPEFKEDSRQRDMFSVAVKVQANHETHYVKTVRVALGVNKATLRHRMCLEPNTWITQLIDFFNVLDYAIPGYTAKDVLTELHLHLWDCAIDYRPLHLHVRSVVTMESFSMSSHLSPKSNTSTLRFIAQECQIHLSDRILPKGIIGTAHKQETVHFIRDYITVVDIKLFELSLRTNDKNSGINPHINLRASNNIVNVHTCSDSGKALIALMTYFAQDGDLTTNKETEEAPSSSRITSEQTHQSDVETTRSNHIKNTMVPAEELIVVDFQTQNISKLSSSQHQQVNDMLGDAMKDCVAPATEAIDNQVGEIGHGAQMFYFPDEGQRIPEILKLPQHVTTDLGDITFRRKKSSDTDDEFCIIGEDAPLGLMAKASTPEIRWLTKATLVIIENHFTIPMGKTDVLKRPNSYPIPIMEYTLREMTIIWHMYGGYDFTSFALTNETAADTSATAKKLAFKDNKIEPNEVGSVVYTNARIGEVLLPKLNFHEAATEGETTKDCSTNRGHVIRGGKGRNTEVLIEVQLSKVKFLHEVYPENGVQASRQVLAINDVEIRDRLISSKINKFLYQYTSEAKPKQSHAHMVVIKAAHIRPDQKLKTQECSLKVSLLPLRLNIDQDSLLFLVTFFSELSGNVSNTNDKTTSKQNTPTHHPPVMTVSNDNEGELKKQAHKFVDENLLILLEEDKTKSNDSEKNMYVNEVEAGSCIYFRSIIFHPEVPIRLDYTGKRVDMSHGSLPGLLMGLGQLNCSELRLKRLNYRHGLLGIEKLVSYCLKEWLMEIKRHQLPSLLGGVGPMHSLIMLAQGIIDLVRLPIEQYQKDGRIVRGLQRGATSFTTSTAMAALELTSRLIHLIQITAETAYDMMSPGPSVRRRRQHANRHGGHRRRRQPEDIRAGAVMAFNVFKEGIEETAANIIRDASHEHEQKGVSGVVGGILRQIPPNVIVKPIILASEATNNLLGGVQNQLVPDAKREANQKWKGDDK